MIRLLKVSVVTPTFQGAPEPVAMQGGSGQRGSAVHLACPSLSVLLSCPGRATAAGGAGFSPPDTEPHLPGPLLTLLVAAARVRLPELQLSSALHAGNPLAAGPPIPACEHLPGEVSLGPGAGHANLDPSRGPEVG